MEIIDHPKVGTCTRTSTYTKLSKLINRCYLSSDLLVKMVVAAGGVPEIGWTVSFSQSREREKSHGYIIRAYCKVCVNIPSIQYISNCYESAENIYRVIIHEIYHVLDKEDFSTRSVGNRRPKWHNRPEEIRAEKEENRELSDYEKELVQMCCEEIQKVKNMS